MQGFRTHHVSHIKRTNHFNHMNDYFNPFRTCHTQEEVKRTYKQQAHRYHPDQRGSHEQWLLYQQDYEYEITNCANRRSMTEIYRTGRTYTYHRQSCQYTHCDHHYHYFRFDKGGTVQIDNNHIHLIKQNEWI